MADKKTKYITEITAKLEKYYSLSESLSTKKQSLSDEIEGFLNAGILLKVITKDEFLEIADSMHFSIHGKSLEQQNLDIKTGFSSIENKWGKYNEPAYIRKNKLSVWIYLQRD